MSRIISPKINPSFPSLKQDKHTYKDVNANSVECVRINQNDEHHGEFLKSVKERVDNMLREGKYYSRELMNCHRQTLPPSPPIQQLANTIYSHHPQDQLENLTMKPKRRRGNLPKATTALLKEWLAAHKKHPYPTEEEKHHLASSTSLSLQQISNWFINARRRHLPHLLESDFVGNKVSQTHELDIFPYEGSDNSAEDSDNGIMRRHVSKCSARINKAGGIKKPYIRKRKTSV
ncbi:17075_t:CDS:2 [Rhizophagus irregularis]|nr:17075_t:CDS:2 [Rhizophagus irregularis]